MFSLRSERKEMMIVTARFGMAAAMLTAVLSTAYSLAQLAEWQGWLGSAGGPNSASTPAGLVVLLLPSLMLGPAFVAMMAALLAAAPAERRVFAIASLAFAAIYAALTGLVYFVQLTFVAPRLAAGQTQDIALLLFRPYESFLFAIDLYGYALMCLACLFAAWALPRVAAAKWARPLLLANGLLTPALALQMQFPWLIWLGALWALVFPAAALALWQAFRELGAPSQGGGD